MVNFRAMTGRFGGWEVIRTMWRQVDVSNGKLTSPSQVDIDRLEFLRVGVSTRWHRVLIALANVCHSITDTVLSYAAAISIPTH